MSNPFANLVREHFAVITAYVELFSRQARPGWTCWGDQVGKFDEVAA